MKTLGTNRWFILVVCMICTLTMGLCYTFGLMQAEFIEYFGVTSAQAYAPYSGFVLGYCIGNYIGGSLQRKYKKITVMIIGAAMIVAGWAGTGFLPQFAYLGLFLTYSVLYGTGYGIFMNTVSVLIQTLFPDRRGFASGMLVSVVGMGTFVFTPVVSGLFAGVGYRRTFVVIAAGSFLVYAVILFLLRNAETCRVEERSEPRTGQRERIPGQPILEDLFHNKLLYVITGLYFCSAPAFMIVNGTFITYGTGLGLDYKFLVAAVSISSICQVLGRFAVPTIGDHIGMRRVLLIVFGVTGVSMFMMSASAGIFFAVGYWIVSFTFGGTQGSFAPMISGLWGTYDMGRIISFTMIGYAVGALGTSAILTAVEPVSAFKATAVLALIGVVFCILLKTNGQTIRTPAGTK